MSTKPDCLFCSEAIISTKIDELGSVFAILDKYPVTEGHTLIIPYRHTTDYFSMTDKERKDAENLLRKLRTQMIQDDSTITGWNVGVNCGWSAGQTIMHAHIHLIPRRDGDIDDPTGGVRGVIPEKRRY